MLRVTSCGALVLAFTLTACGKKSATPADSTPAAAPAAAAAPAGPAPTGRVIVVKMITDEKNSRFEPSEIEANPGDVVRFTLEVGVHNVHFLPDSNPGVPNLPPMGEMLQLPGQTTDIPVNFAPGKTYFFQCDPHAALGMVGHLKVVAAQ